MRLLSVALAIPALVIASPAGLQSLPQPAGSQQAITGDGGAPTLHRPPAGLSDDEWRQIRHSLRHSSRHSANAGPAFVHEAQIFAEGDPIGDEFNYFGYSVSISGTTLVVGAPGEQVGFPYDAGSAYVFVRVGGTWTLQQRLYASDGALSDSFGQAVALSGDDLVVSAPYATTPGASHSGAAYVFVRSGNAWTEQQKLIGSNMENYHGFGTAVAISGQTVAITAPAEVPQTTLGSAYVFVRYATSWTEQANLTVGDGYQDDHFGYSVALYGDTLVVGAPRAMDPGGADAAGAAYVFQRAGTAWTQQQKIVASDATILDEFGSSVSVYLNTIAVGAPNDDTAAGFNAGSAYLFVRSGSLWNEQQKVTAADAAPEGWFGFSIAVSSDTVVVGALLDTPSGGSPPGAAYVFIRSGSTWTQQQRLDPNDGAPGDRFAWSVSISGNTVVSGALMHDTVGGADAGSAYVFVRAGSTWTQQQELLGLDGDGDWYGYFVAVSGDTAVVGAPRDDTAGGDAAGSATVFVRAGGSWVGQQKLTASDAADDDLFGLSVSVSGDTIVVGAYQHDTPAGANAGAAYVFARSGSVWTEQQKLTASDAAAADRFGSAVSVAGSTVVVGADGDQTAGGPGAGSVYVFFRSGTTWSEQQHLLAADGSAGDRFGTAVAIYGDTALIGAIGDDGSRGSAYAFVRSGTTWSQQQKLVASDGIVLDRFGWAVSVYWDTALVGAPYDDAPTGTATDAGSAYVFVRSGSAWAEQQKIVASDAAAYDLFGNAVSVYGDVALVGAPDNGMAYVFQRSGSVWTEQQMLPQTPTFGFGAALSADVAVVGGHLDDLPLGRQGSAHVYRDLSPHTDLAVSKTDGQAAAVPGETVVYTIVVSNAGPLAATGAVVNDPVAPALLGATWTCSASPGSTCSASGSGSISDTIDLLAGGTATYLLSATIAGGATGTLSNGATVTNPASLPDPNPANNMATDLDTLGPETDLTLSKADVTDPVAPGDMLSYTLTFGNEGPSDATAITVVDDLPADVTLVSSIPGPPTCTLAGSALTCGFGAFPAGASGTILVNVS